MNKQDFIHKISCNLRENNMRRPVRPIRHTFHISDDEGNSKDFVIKTARRDYIYSEDDVRCIIEAALEVITEALKQGDDVTINGYGTIGLHYRKERRVRDRRGNGIYHVVPGHNVPKLKPGKYLTVAAKIHDMNTLEQEKRIEYRYDELVPDADDE